MLDQVKIDARGGSNRKKLNHSFFQSWAPAMSYVLGLIYSDGAVEDVQKSSRTCYLAISSIDEELLIQVKSVMQSEHKLYPRAARSQIFPGGTPYQRKTIYTLRIGSKKIYNDLIGFGLTPRKSLTLSFPKIPIGYLSYFIRGYFDGDGSIALRNGRNPRVTFTSGSKEFLDSLISILKNQCGIEVCTLVNHRSTISNNLVHQLIYGGNGAQSLLKFMYSDLEAAPYLRRKYAVYQKFLNLAS